MIHFWEQRQILWSERCLQKETQEEPATYFSLHISILKQKFSAIIDR